MSHGRNRRAMRMLVQAENSRQEGAVTATNTTQDVNKAGLGKKKKVNLKNSLSLYGQEEEDKMMNGGSIWG